MKRRICALAALLLTLPCYSHAGMNILVARTVEIPGASGYDNDVEQQLRVVLGNSGLGHLDFTLASTNIFPSLCSGSTNNFRAIISCLETDLAPARDQLYADIVVVVVRGGPAPPYAGHSDARCGLAKMYPGTQFSIDVSNHASGYAVVREDCLEGGDSAAHEIGHLLYLEHQIGLLGRLDVLPRPDNHGYESPTLPGFKTIMVDGGSFSQQIFSDPRNSFDPAGLHAAGNANTANNVFVVGQLSWGVVAQYREAPPPAPPKVSLCLYFSNTCTDHDIVVVPDDDSGPINSLHVWYDWLYSPVVDFQFFGVFSGLELNWFQKGNVQLKIHAVGPGGDDVCWITLPIPIIGGDDYCGYTP